MGVNVTDPSVRKEKIEKVVGIAKLVKKYGGTYVVIAVNGRRPLGAAGRGSQGPDTFNYKEHKTDMVAALNDYGMAVADLGLSTGLHQHTGTVGESRDEVYAVMEAVNTKVMAFAPDVGQLQKAGSDAAQVVKDFAKNHRPHALEGLQQRKVHGRLLPAGYGCSEYRIHSEHAGTDGPQSRRDART
jgi:inosose dehydratase